ncbi:MAG TPA: hypothetical protein VM101_15740 [Flavitalea sp.]|nr:hypothetical protein [Flavitalea sp.]
MELSELSDAQLQTEYLKLELRYNMLYRMADPKERQKGPLAELKMKLIQMQDEIKKRGTVYRR